MEVTVGLNDKGKGGHIVISTNAQVFIIFLRCMIVQMIVDQNGREYFDRWQRHEKDLENQESKSKVHKVHVMRINDNC